MNKLVGAIMILISGTMIGIHFGQCLKDRLHSLKVLQKTVSLLKGEIRYSMTTLPEALKNISMYVEEPFKSVFVSVSEDLIKYDGKSFYEIWREKIEQNVLNLHLTKEQLYQLYALGENLGFLDKEMQLDTLDLYDEQVSHHISELEGSIANNVKLYNCIGIMGAILIVIIIV